MRLISVIVKVVTAVGMKDAMASPFAVVDVQGVEPYNLQWLISWSWLG